MQISITLGVTLLLILICILILYYLRKNKVQEEKFPEPPEPEMKSTSSNFSYIFSIGITFDQLKLYNGEDGKPFYTSLKHHVFDVSEKTAYTKGTYRKFVGYDCSVNMAKHDFDINLLNTYSTTRLDLEES